MDVLPHAILGSAAFTALAMYLDAKFSVSKDLAQIQSARRGQKFSKGLFEKHGHDDWSFYHIMHVSHAVRAKIGSDEALQFEGRSWSYNDLRQEIGRVAEALANAGVKNRTVVCLFMDNSPEFIFTWWALFKLGAIPAPINTKFKTEHIRHCARLCESSFLICTTELWGVIREAFYDCQDSVSGHHQTTVIYNAGTYTSGSPDSSLPEGVVYWDHDKFPPARPGITDDYPVQQRPKIGPTMPVQYLFTSGTTGLPKAVCYPAGYCLMLANHRRWPGMFDIRRRLYICLPLFHGTAQVAAMPAVLMTFGTVILARRFSRREFWSDIRKSNANAILYIGEMLRYLVQCPPDPRFPDERDHKVTLAFGLGLAPTVWKAFRERFGVDWIVEYYSATEATASLLNSNRNNYAGVGKVAHWGPLMRKFGQDTFYIVKADLESGEILRDPRTGFCIPAKMDEPGEAICRIRPPIQRKHDYVGDGGAEATEKKTLRNVFSKGDEFFRLGDALSMDSDGYISFSDRLGDTYRVKGHNVSTTEVENCLSRHPDIASANVYAIPMNQYGYEGQLGCAAIELHAESWDRVDKIICGLEQWMTSSEQGIPVYAVPRFLRVIRDSDNMVPGRGSSQGNEIERVSTIMKKVKVGLRKEGFWPAGGTDQMYWIEKEGSGYVPLVEATARSLRAGEFRL